MVVNHYVAARTVDTALVLIRIAIPSLCMKINILKMQDALASLNWQLVELLIVCRHNVVAGKRFAE